MTHFASSGNYDSRQTEDQIVHFEAVLSALRARGPDAALRSFLRHHPSGLRSREAWGTWSGPAMQFTDTSRRRAAGSQTPVLAVKPALTWKATVLAVKDLEAGSLIGYGGIHRAERPMRIAVLAAGYADGIPHRLSNRGQVIAKGKLAPIVGAVSMDLTTIDVTASPELQVGDAVTLLGSEGEVVDRRAADGAGRGDDFLRRAVRDQRAGQASLRRLNRRAD